MQKKDFIVRQLEEFGKVMALILGFKKERDWEKFEKEIADAGRKFTSLDIAVVESMNRFTFEKEVLNHPNLNLDQKKILADLLFEKMTFNLEKGNQPAYLRLKEHCLDLYAHIRENFTENEFDLNVHYKLEYLGKTSS